jgi:Txe/YoeB family toxin of Txe-Axe toxin-antitoxin module
MSTTITGADTETIQQRMAKIIHELQKIINDTPHHITGHPDYLDEFDGTARRKLSAAVTLIVEAAGIVSVGELLQRGIE